MKHSNFVIFISELVGTFGLLVAATISVVYDGRFGHILGPVGQTEPAERKHCQLRNATRVDPAAELRFTQRVAPRCRQRRRIEVEHDQMWARSGDLVCHQQVVERAPALRRKDVYLHGRLALREPLDSQLELLRYRAVVGPGVDRGVPEEGHPVDARRLRLRLLRPLQPDLHLGEREQVGPGTLQLGRVHGPDEPV